MRAHPSQFARVRAPEKMPTKWNIAASILLRERGRSISGAGGSANIHIFVSGAAWSTGKAGDFPVGPNELCRLIVGPEKSNCFK